MAPVLATLVVPFRHWYESVPALVPGPEAAATEIVVFAPEAIVVVAAGCVLMVGAALTNSEALPLVVEVVTAFSVLVTTTL
jgi:hypothetical protein